MEAFSVSVCEEAVLRDRPKQRNQLPNILKLKHLSKLILISMEAQFYSVLWMMSPNSGSPCCPKSQTQTHTDMLSCSHPDVLSMISVLLCLSAPRQLGAAPPSLHWQSLSVYCFACKPIYLCDTSYH